MGRHRLALARHAERLHVGGRTTSAPQPDRERPASEEARAPSCQQQESAAG
jgi:hypothetical protein